MHQLTRLGCLLLVSALLLIGCSKDNALVKAVQEQNLNQVRTLIEEGANVNAVTKKGTPLTVACQSDILETARRRDI